MKKAVALLLDLLMVIFFSSCAVPTTNSSTDSSIVSSSPVTEKSAAEKLLSQMTLQEKIMQLFIIEPGVLLSNSPSTQVLPKDAKNLENLCVGGFILFANNIQNPTQTAAYTKALKNCKIFPFIAIDEEGGRVARIANNPNFSVTRYRSMLSLGGDADKAYSVGQNIGAYLKQYGFNLNFAPVADVFTNPKNTVIGNRAFSSDPEVVAKTVESNIKGFHSNNIMTAAKHFPGHGDTAEDSHFGLAKTNKSWQELKTCEMLPFISAIESGCDMIMVGHIAAPAVTGDNTPATLSYTLITEKLKGELGFEGIVITDSMRMKGITDKYDSATAAVMAIKAGADIILMPQNFTLAVEGIKSAVQRGEISQERIDQSVLKILSLKEKYQLIN